MSSNPVKTELCLLAEKYKTDKVPSVFHSYTPYYHELLKDRRDKVKRVLEIGIGYPETMRYGHTEGYVTGASLYMWRDYFPGAKIFALDNNLKALEEFCAKNLETNRLVALYCDQSDRESLAQVAETLKVGGLFDLIVDDGSHVPEHQALTARMLAPLLTPDGIYIIEDVLETHKTTAELPLKYEVKDFENSAIHDDRVVVMRAENKPALRPVTIVVLSKYREILNPFADSVNKYANKTPVTCVLDGLNNFAEESLNRAPWLFVKGPEQFSMAGNGNLGLKAVPLDHDILYCGDDVRFTSPNTIEILQEVAYAHPEVGILSPQLVGRSSPALAYPQTECDYVNPLGMWFPCVYIKRELIEKIGYLDERFSNFGSDDLDYNIRTELAGYRLAVTNRVSVEHECDAASGGPTTFVRKLGKEEWERQQQSALGILRDKYNLTDAVLGQFLATNDLSLLSAQTTSASVGVPATAPGSRRGLEGKSLFIMVPMRQPTMNFVISWTHLILALQKYGVGCEYMFLNNESLVTRARNRLADHYLKKSACTHALLVDDDIGFEAMDILAMLDMDLEIAGAPCVKKSIRWDRVQEVILKNAAKNGQGRKLTPEDLSKVAGDFILNFDKFSGRKQFNLGEPQLAHSVGTGLAMIRRDVFSKLAEAYPDRWYDSSRFDPASLPGRTQDFFMAGVNYDTRDYDSEDYRFCIEARKLGMSVWVLPWMKTSHSGAFLFTGDLPKMAELAPDWVL